VGNQAISNVVESVELNKNLKEDAFKL
jgi:hypothetical protein